MSPQAQKWQKFNSIIIWHPAVVVANLQICKFTHLLKYIEYVDVLTMKTIKEYNLIYVCQ